MSTIGFGDNVRVRITPLTEAAGVAGLEGSVAGWTTPSVTNVDVVGATEGDEAFNVMFEAPERSLWFAPDLLELVDHAPGTEIRLAGVAQKWTRTADGGWLEEPLQSVRTKPWWKFW